VSHPDTLQRRKQIDHERLAQAKFGPVRVEDVTRPRAEPIGATGTEHQAVIGLAGRPAFSDAGRFITYGPTNKKAYEGGLISDAVAATLPSSPENAAKQISLDIAWYEQHEQEAATLYQDMMME